MHLPAFYSQAPRLLLRDPLAELLGAAEGGLLEYGYADAVRLAGHSCPTVAGAYLAVRAALRELYPDALPERGGIQVTLSSAEVEGSTGVIAQVFTLVTGAAANNGFPGLAGRHARHGLLRYGGGDLRALAAFRRIDSGDTVHVALNLAAVPPVAHLRSLMERALAADASGEERAAFASAWQDRVRQLLLEHADDPALVRAERRT
ncbi:FmdE family protein [Thermomonas haemolytica]|uniref:Formylmethanofuran dehydrogenase subunit E n=1 Tax=Thermomonas haemolytica TaxID=141949 RepID=A0A4R3N1G3_9GAMM|nr:FmdE family protein [Thermomonas haemolytica]TCT22554.1 formylmethanofuran dehydrogenase subunit E [Thermomonas haemolytica]TNY29202.1 hypothetical protein BV505_05945 [Thermomonas haemolytica]